MADFNFNKSYTGLRPDVLKLIPGSANDVLDIGCSTGELGVAIKEKTRARVVGVDISKEMGIIASQKIDEVIIGDIENVTIMNKIKEKRFDVIVMADVLEHLINPWNLLAELVNVLHPQGVIVASIPNARHIDTIYNLLIKGYWPHRERGIHDKNHLRFFTRKNIIELFKGAGFKIDGIEANYRLIERPHYLNQYAKYLAFPVVNDFITFQYLILARKI